MIKNSLIISLAISLLLAVTTLSNAETATTVQSPNLSYQAGWQVTGAASGFSLKIPLRDQFYIQPLFTIGMNEAPGNTSANATGHFALGIRGIRKLPERGNFQPYIGAGCGHSEDFAGATLALATVTKGTTGLEVFLGMEYQKYSIRPSLEIGLGSYNRADGGYFAGTTINFALMYSF